MTSKTKPSRAKRGSACTDFSSTKRNARSIGQFSDEHDVVRHDLAVAVELRDLTDPTCGPHAMQLLLDDVVTMKMKAEGASNTMIIDQWPNSPR